MNKPPINIRSTMLYAIMTYKAKLESDLISLTEIALELDAEGDPDSPRRHKVNTLISDTLKRVDEARDALTHIQTTYLD